MKKLLGAALLAGAMLVATQGEARANGGYGFGLGFGIGVTFNWKCWAGPVPCAQGAPCCKQCVIYGWSPDYPCPTTYNARALGDPNALKYFTCQP